MPRIPKYNKKTKKELKEIGSKIKAIRTKQGLSQEELAFRADISMSYVAGIERGEHNASAIYIKKIAKALKVPSSKLLD